MEQFAHGTNGGWVKFPGNPVLGGELGVCFDVSLLQEDGLIRMYFSWRTQKSVALTTSTDGIHWSEPVICMAPRDRVDGKEDRISRPAVTKRGSIWHMWYTGQYLAGEKDGTSDLFHAVSEDGVHFTRTGDDPVMSSELPWEKQAVMCPCVLWDEERGVFRMWYSAGEQYEPNAIGYAESADGIHWHKDPRNPIFTPDRTNEWEQHKVTACQVIAYHDWFYMFYIGFHNEDYAQIGLARSKDGVTNWERSSLNPIVAPDKGAWDAEACYKPFVLQDGNGWKLWYNGRRGTVEQIGLVTLAGEEIPF